MKMANNLTINEIPETLQEEIYREREFMYRVSDAKRHIENLGYDDVLTEDDAKDVAQRFIYEYDCNLAENRMFENIIEEVVALKGATM